jgi:LDH2 family malate/lactate/ureidoglycolate dehydrogenase
MSENGSNARVTREALEAFCVAAMRRAGMTEADARLTAEVLVTTDTWGTHTHGTKQIRNLMKNFREGRMDIKARAELVGEGPGWARFDGHASMPMPTSVRAMETAIAKAKNTGIAISTVNNSGHYGAAGYYAWLATKYDMIGLSFSNVDPGVAAPGSRGSVLGTNPLAYAVPAGKEHPVMMDIATSVVAASKIYALRQLGKPLPEGWIVDGDGLPTTDPGNYPLAGALLPMAGHKGYGIGLMVELLTGVLAGGAFGHNVRSWVFGDALPVNQSHTFIAINVGVFEPIEEFKQRTDSLIRQIKDAPKAKGADRIWLPGEKEWEYRAKALAEGIALPQDVRASLKGLAEDLGMSAAFQWGAE